MEAVYDRQTRPTGMYLQPPQGFNISQFQPEDDGDEGRLEMKVQRDTAKRRVRIRAKRTATAKRSPTNTVFDRIQQALQETEEQKKKKGVYPDETM